ncbi:Cyclopropane-fatty-acyl-phospholipid synthase [Defluviimonas aquaemixtae]|uniref:Cyclopropane-fatty-acyl-phospholipid synthase n=1 Tax=Albidovulum aquaemixtae TaxID=1542388 RepID=A0A2R8BNE8_9RHOB|nr:cyclopropane-fatty-acyl-phospholipid synthase family protein [Defluviimonas aquaemixtae]SPH24945.1 Cyclopropane-fatty-acyl-phospholipid synthase [Defluviimonas aquaemixtae]
MWTKFLDQFLAQFLRHGTLDVVLPDGQTRSYGDGSQPRMAVHLHDADLPRKLVLRPDLALGEAYMDGRLTVEGDDIATLLALLVTNRSAQPALWWRKPLDKAADWLRVLNQINPVGRSLRNVSHHYDLTPELYALFLDRDRQYSCAYFAQPDDTLEAAQAQKKALIAAKLCLEPGMRVLDIGCGWGGLALTLAREHQVKVLGITLSKEQLAIAQARARAEGLAKRVEFRLADYRTLQGQFDRIVSVGMFEHVGLPHYRTYFGQVRKLLTENGVALLHTIGNAGPPMATGAWIRKYIFPGGYIPSMSECLRAIEAEDLWTTDVEVWRLHYAETLSHWRERFEANIDKARALHDDRFCRMWRYYLAGSEMTFRHAKQCVFQFQLARRLDAVPLTRDYLMGAGRAPMPMRRGA